MWDLPRPGLEPVSPALAGRFSTTAPPGKPSKKSFLTCYSIEICNCFKVCCKYNSKPNTSPWSQLTAWGSLGYPLPSFHKHLFPGTVPGTKDQSRPAWWSIGSRRADRWPSSYQCDKRSKRAVPCIGAEHAWDLSSSTHFI